MLSLHAEYRNLVRNLLLIYLVVWTAGILVFWVFCQAGDAAGFSLVYLWMLLPAASFVLSLKAGMRGCPGTAGWIMAACFGVLYMLGEYFTFSMANNLAFHKVNLPHVSMILAGAAVSWAGMGIGCLICAGKK